MKENKVYRCKRCNRVLKSGESKYHEMGKYCLEKSKNDPMPGQINLNLEVNQMKSVSIYHDVIEHYGKDAQLLKTLEELEELGEVISLQLQGKKVKREHIKEEIADNYNMLEQFRIINGFTKGDIDAEMRRKMQRTKERMEEELRNKTQRKKERMEA